MFSPGNILRFNNFKFPNGSPSKPKYFIVLNSIDDEVVVASLPTSKDHIPDSIPKTHGCINNEGMCINCYYFEKDKIISECGTFGFPRDTFVYGEQVMLLDKDLLICTYKDSKDYEKLCKMENTEFKSLKHCLTLSRSLKKKIKQYL